MSESDGYQLVGTRIDRYAIHELVGEGGMGFVYRATSERGHRVAIKVLRAELVDKERFALRFSGEVDIGKRLHHANLIRVEASGSFADGRPYLVMEYVDGRTLADVLIDEHRLDWHRALTLARQVLLALAELHDLSVVHRDIKPENIFVLNTDLGERVKLFDLGLAKMVGDKLDNELTQPGFALGTPTYLAPERVDRVPTDPRSDLYSVAVVLYEMLVGVAPFRGDTPQAVVRGHLDKEVPKFLDVAPSVHVPREVEALVRRALAKEPGQRFANAREFAMAIEPVLLARISTRLSYPFRSLRDFAETTVDGVLRRPRWVQMAVAFSALAMLAVLVVRWMGSSSQTPALGENEGVVLPGDGAVGMVVPALARDLGRAWWGENAREVRWELATSRRGGDCVDTEAHGLHVTLCRYANSASAVAARDEVQRTVLGTTQVSVARGSSLLIVVDGDHADPEGRRIQAMIGDFTSVATR